MDRLFPSTEAEEPITVTPGEIIARRRRRRRLLELADELGNVSEACRIMGVSRTRFYAWRNVALEYGLEALVPKQRRAPQMPNATQETCGPLLATVSKQAEVVTAGQV
jgi:Helix-turn-helix domain